MNPERHEKHPPEDDLRLPPEILHTLATCQLGPGMVPPEIDAAILRAGSARMAEIRDSNRPRPVASFLWPLAAAACLLLAFFLRPHDSGNHPDLPSVEHKEDAAAIILREFSALYPNQVRAITQDSQGIHLSLADRPGQVSGQALVLKICQATGCKEIITFSGQDIEVAGQAVTVRTEKGRIILDGEQFIWSSDHHGNPAPDIHIESRWL
jgi:hypothetical protein